MERDPKFCPYLGLHADANTFFIYVSPRHRCFRGETPEAIHPADQELFCLGGNYKECPRYQGIRVGKDGYYEAPEDTAVLGAAAEEDPDAAWEPWELPLSDRVDGNTGLRRFVIQLALLLALCPGCMLLSQYPAVSQWINRVLYVAEIIATPTPTKTVMPTFPPAGTALPTLSPTRTDIPTWTLTPPPTATPRDTPTDTTTPPPPTATLPPTATAAPSEPPDTPAPPTEPLPPTAPPTLAPTYTPLPTYTPFPTATPLPTPTPEPLYRQRGTTRYYPNCDMTKVQGIVYDYFDDPQPGVYIRLWNDYGYAAPLARSEDSGGPHDLTGYWEVYLDDHPKKEIWNVAVVDPDTGEKLSSVVQVRTTDRDCDNEGGRQVVILDWMEIDYTR